MQKDTRTRSYMLTVPFRDCSEDELKAKLDTYDYVYQLEQGTDSAYQHFQVLMRHTNPVRFSTLKRKFPTAHIEVTRDVDDAFTYVTKDETALAITQEGELVLFSDTPSAKKIVGMKGNWQGVGKKEKAKGKNLSRPELIEHVKQKLLLGVSVEEILLDSSSQAAFYPGMVQTLADAVASEKHKEASRVRRSVKAVYVRGSNLSELYAWAFDKFPSAFFVVNYDRPFDTYRSESTLVFPDFAGQLPVHQMVSYLRGFPLELPVRRYQTRWATWNKVIVLSRRSIDAVFGDYTFPHEVAEFVDHFGGKSYSLADSGRLVRNAVDSPAR